MTKSYKAEMSASMSDASFTPVRWGSRDYGADRQLKKANVLTLPTLASISPTHSRTDTFTRPTFRLLRKRFHGTCHQPGRGPSDFPHFAL